MFSLVSCSASYGWLIVLYLFKIKLNLPILKDLDPVVPRPMLLVKKEFVRHGAMIVLKFSLMAYGAISSALSIDSLIRSMWFSMLS